MKATTTKKSFVIGEKQTPPSLNKTKKWQRWKPFHSWLNGRPKTPIVLGLTEVNVRDIKIALQTLGFSIDDAGCVLTSNQKRALRTAKAILNRRNLKPLTDNEEGSIRAKDA